jgi:hypothetical protein
MTELIAPAVLDIRQPTFEIQELMTPAESMFERLVTQIQEFEARLTPTEEIGGRFVSAPKEGAFHIRDISHRGPDMLVFHGIDVDGRPIQLLQHYTQMNVLLCVMPIVKEEPFRIGFILEQRLGR